MARPVAVFAMGPLKDEAKDWQDVRAQLDKELLKFPWLAPGRRRGLRRQARPGEADLPTQPDPGAQTDAGDRHPRLDGDLAPGRSAWRRSSRRNTDPPRDAAIGKLEAPMGSAVKVLTPGVLFILTLAFGVWLSRSGKP